MVPSRATENRHPNELVAPKMCSPSAMIHLPTGGMDHEVGFGAEHVRGAVGKHGIRALDACGHPSLEAVLEQGVALLDVVGLVEDELVRSTELPEPQESADRRDDKRSHPAPQHVGGLEPEQPGAKLLGRRHGCHRM